MNARVVICAVSFAAVSILCCSSFEMKDRREGIIKDKKTIRVFVKISRFDDTGIEYPEKADEKIINAAKERYADIIRGYAASLKGKENADDIELQMLKKEKEPFIFFQSNYEEYIHAYVDFPVSNTLTDMLVSLEEIKITESDDED